MTSNMFDQDFATLADLIGAHARRFGEKLALVGDDRSFTYLGYNLNPEMTTLFQDQAVRQALYFALDRQAIVNDILLEYATVAEGTQPIISYAYAPEEATISYSYDPDRARALLADAR